MTKLNLKPSTNRNRFTYKSLLGLLVALVPLLFTSCSDIKLAEKLDGSWKAKYSISFDDGEKDKVVEIMTFKYDDSSIKDDGTFREERSAKTNEMEDEGVYYSIHYSTSVTGRYEVLNGDLYLKYDLSTLVVNIDGNDISIRTDGDYSDYDMASVKQEVAKAAKAECHKNMYQLYKQLSSGDYAYKNLKIEGDEMSYVTDDGNIKYHKVGASDSSDNDESSDKAKISQDESDEDSEGESTESGNDSKTLLMSGKINNKYPITMQLVIDGNNITGWYYYDKYKSKMGFSGMLDKGGAVTLNCDGGDMFEGTLYDDGLNGDFIRGTDSASMPFFVKQ